MTASLKSHTQQNNFALDPEDNARLANLCGPFDEHLRQIELRLGVEINHRGSVFEVIGEGPAVKASEKVLRALYVVTEEESLNGAKVHLHLAESGIDAITEASTEGTQEVAIRVKRGVIKGRGANQARYLHAIATHDINFGIGPAGTGKTYLAIAKAVEALEAGSIGRIVLSRPAVEAGESLGFLPGEMEDKLAPYLRPLYDALSDRLSMKRVRAMMSEGLIEIAPIGFMRGRTLNNAFVVIDEAQNCTYGQLKMLLTRLGWNSTMVITGDPNQSDLLPGVSGLGDVATRLEALSDVAVVRLQDVDIVRHPLVASMLGVL